MKYQLVLQLPGTSIKDYDAMIELEEAIIDNLGEIGVVDGHDAGSGEMNIFIHTNQPQRAFDDLRELLTARNFMSSVRAAFREIGSDSFTILHPPRATSFSIV